MKVVLAGTLSFLLCFQTIYAMPERETIAYEETEGTKTENAEAETEENPEAPKTVGVEISAPSGILMEASTGQIIFEKEAEMELAPASVTKIMTLLLIFDAIDSGKIKPEDEVTVSEFAASLGGSQVFFEPGEVQTVDTMIKCIAVASANDACVAMSEFISGSEEAFVVQMNERAKGLGMSHTNFVNCNGLDAEGHLTTARDIALMSRELIGKYPQVHDYSMIWMENITHTTRKGTSEFGLTNTNKLVHQYEYATGLKTGSTGNAKFCVSATAEKNGIELIAVIMAAEDSKVRFRDATALLNSGFGKCQLYKDEKPPKLKKIKIQGGVEEMIDCKYKEVYTYLDMTGADLNKITKELIYENELKAPINKGDKVGSVVYRLDGQKLGSMDVTAAKSMKKAGFVDYLLRAIKNVLM